MREKLQTERRVPPDASSLIMTEGEFNTMAVYQAVSLPAVILPNRCRSLPAEVLALLVWFDEVILWMDDDGTRRDGAEKFTRKLALERCLLPKCTNWPHQNEAN